jgi:hypothetical protein
MEKRYFQYIAGDDIGEIKVLKNVILEEGTAYLEFTDGDLMNRDFVAPITNKRSDLKNKFMVEISSRDNAWTIEDIKERVVKLGDDKYEKNVPPIEDYMSMDGTGERTTVKSAIGGKRLVPPKTNTETRPLPKAKEEISGKIPSSQATKEEIEEAYGGKIPTQQSVKETEDNYEDVVVVTEEKKVEEHKEENKQQEVIVEKSKDVLVEQKKQDIPKSSLNLNDPVVILVNSSKKAEYDLPVNLSIMLPQKSLYKIVSEQFDDGKDKFIQCILDGLDVSDVIKSIGEALKLSYES